MVRAMILRTVIAAGAALSVVVCDGCVLRADAGEREPCLPSQTECLVEGRPRCIDPSSDRAHCGACSNSCAAGDVCSAGRCAATVCAHGELRCDEGDVLQCAADRSWFERIPCDRGTHCANGACVDTVAQWPSAWSLSRRESPAAQQNEPWQRWGGACGATRLDAARGETAVVFTSDRTFHSRPFTWPPRGAWAVQARVWWQRDASVRVSIGAYVSVGETINAQMHQLWLNGESVVTRHFGQPDQPLETRTTSDQWHDVRFEADTDRARARWLLDGRTVHEEPLAPMDAFGAYFVLSGYGSCNVDVWASGDISFEVGS